MFSHGSVSMTWETSASAVQIKKSDEITLDLSQEAAFIPPLSLSTRSHTMSQHNSFKAAGGSGKKNRTVLKRFERIELLRKRGQWEDGNRVVGLKKTKPEE
jgi:small basic protein (TIGR04137 family)